MECPVCFSVLEDESSSLTSCNHSLCITCLNKIIQEGNNKCPLCRSNIEGYFNKGEKAYFNSGILRWNIDPIFGKIEQLSQRDRGLYSK